MNAWTPYAPGHSTTLHLLANLRMTYIHWCKCSMVALQSELSWALLYQPSLCFPNVCTSLLGSSLLGAHMSEPCSTCMQDIEITPSGFPELRSPEVTPRRISDS